MLKKMSASIPAWRVLAIRNVEPISVTKEKVMLLHPVAGYVQ